MPKGLNDVPQFDSIGKVMLENSLPEHCPEEARKLSFKFTKADQLEWGKEKFKDVEFYNMRGFDIKFADNEEHLCHIQLWAAGKGTNAGVHNHATDRFCEVHACIINGNRNSGMQYLNSSQETYDPFTTLDSDFVKLDIPSFYEHGPLWDIDAKKQPVLRNDGTVIYPWHKWQSGSDDLSDKTKIDINSIFENGPFGIVEASYEYPTTYDIELTPTSNNLTIQIGGQLYYPNFTAVNRKGPFPILVFLPGKHPDCRTPVPPG
ncbi:unnamed protein product, partial [Adineta steineri]